MAEDPKVKIVIKKDKPGFFSVEKGSIYRKVATAFLLMSIIPILLMLYILFVYPNPAGVDHHNVNLKLLVFLSICSSLVGYWIVRKLAASVSSMAKNAQVLMEGKNPGAIQVGDQSEEVRELVKVFNNVTHNLEQQITKLEQSKQLIQDLLKKIGAVITSDEKMDNIFDLIIESMVKALDAESGLLVILEEDQKTVRSSAFYGKEREKLSGMMARNPNAFVWLLNQNQVFIASHSEGGTSSQDEWTYRSVLCVPLRYQNRREGSIAIFNKNSDTSFSRDDGILLQNVATQIAVAAENSRLTLDAERSYVETIGALAIAVEERDLYTRGHLQRVADYVVRIAKEIGMGEKEIQTLKDAAFLHDIGKIAIEDRILLKPGKFTPEERKIMETHPEKGEKIIAPLRSFKDLREIVRHHQEWYDGSGYPDHVKGEQISLSARILTVADVYDALTTDRPYRKGCSHEEALKMIEREAGTHFDPQVVKVFLKIIRENPS